MPPSCVTLVAAPHGCTHGREIIISTICSNAMLHLGQAWLLAVSVQSCSLACQAACQAAGRILTLEVLAFQEACTLLQNEKPSMHCGLQNLPPGKTSLPDT